MGRTTHIWLDAMCAVVVLTGIAMAGGALPQTEGPARLLLEWQNGGPLPIDRPSRVVLGVLGGVMCGWGVTLYVAFKALDAIPAGPERARLWRMVLAALLFWFAVDSSLSIATGFTLNAVMNIGFLAGFLIPISLSGVLRQ